MRAARRAGAASSTPFGSAREPGCEGCQNGARCVLAPNSQAYYCECSGTQFTGVNCTVPAGQAVSVAASVAAPPPPGASNTTEEAAKAGAAVPKSLDGATRATPCPWAVAGG